MSVSNTVKNKGRLQTLVFTFLCQSTLSITLAGLPLMLPLIRQDLGLNFSQAGGLASASLLVYALMQIPAGFLADHYSPRKLVSIGSLGLMGLSILMGLTSEYWQLLGIQFFWGFFSAFLFTPAMSLFIGWFSAQHRNTATTLPMVGPNIGVFAVNLLFPVIVNRFDTWRMPFILFGAAGIIFALLLLVFGREAPSKKSPAEFRLDIFRDIFRHKQVWICYGLQFIRFGIVQGIGFWLPSLLLNEKQFPLQLAGTVIALQTIVGAPSSILGSYISDRYKKPIMVIAVSLAMLGITSYLMVTLNSVALIIAVIFINAIFIQAYFGPLFTMAIETVGPEKTGISNGVSNTFAIFGGLVSSLLMGFLRDATGSFEWGFYSICALTVIGLILTFILKKTRAKNTSPESLGNAPKPVTLNS